MTFTFLLFLNNLSLKIDKYTLPTVPVSNTQKNQGKKLNFFVYTLKATEEKSIIRIVIRWRGSGSYQKDTDSERCFPHLRPDS